MFKPELHVSKSLLLNCSNNLSTMTDIYNPGVGARVMEKFGSEKQVGSGKTKLVKSHIDEELHNMAKVKHNYSGSMPSITALPSKRKGRRRTKRRGKKKEKKQFGSGKMRTSKGRFKKSIWIISR